MCGGKEGAGGGFESDWYAGVGLVCWVGVEWRRGLLEGDGVGMGFVYFFLTSVLGGSTWAHGNSFRTVISWVSINLERH